MAFNVMCMNMDDHTKNISFLMDRSGRWSLSPAYDMLYSNSYYSGPVGVIGGADAPGSVRLISFVLNPALGLACLLASQTGLLRESFSSYSYTLYEMYDYLDFAGMAWLSMAFMASAGAVLNLLAALFVRPRGVRVRGERKGSRR